MHIGKENMTSSQHPLTLVLQDLRQVEFVGIITLTYCHASTTRGLSAREHLRCWQLGNVPWYISEMGVNIFYTIQPSDYHATKMTCIRYCGGVIVEHVREASPPSRL